MAKSTMSAGLSYLHMTPEQANAKSREGASRDKATRLPRRLARCMAACLDTAPWFHTYHSIRSPEFDDRLLSQYVALDDWLCGDFD